VRASIAISRPTSSITVLTATDDAYRAANIAARVKLAATAAARVVVVAAAAAEAADAAADDLARWSQSS
jgi:hypothetical protein